MSRFPKMHAMRLHFRTRQTLIRKRPYSRRGVVALVLVVCGFASVRFTLRTSAREFAQQPGAVSRLNLSDLSYVGAFRVPPDAGLDFGGGALAYNAANN